MIIPLFFKFLFEDIGAIDNKQDIIVNVHGGQILNSLFMEINNRAYPEYKSILIELFN